MKTSIDRLAKDLPKEREERRQADEEIARQIEGLAVGGLHLEAVGLFWLTLGLLAANLPDEIARLMSLVRR